MATNDSEESPRNQRRRQLREEARRSEREVDRVLRQLQGRDAREVATVTLDEATPEQHLRHMRGELEFAAPDDQENDDDA